MGSPAFRKKHTSTNQFKMETLIPIVSKLQDVFTAIGSRASELQLPQIVVVGSQSAGKSSVLEGIVGRFFLPRGSGIVTRRPLILHLVYAAPDDPVRKRDETFLERDWADFEHNSSKIFDPVRKRNETFLEKDWAVFEHNSSKIFEDFECIRMEIEKETDRLTGSNKGISDEPIVLTIYSDSVVNLSVVDLPGITKVAVGDQPKDIEKQIRNMILNYIKNENSLILAVTPANQDFANSEALQIAKEVDPEGDRTLVVLTKLDIMDRGTNAIEVLEGNVIPVKLGIVGVINRCQEDINIGKSIEESIKDEEAFLAKAYPSICYTQGTKYLSKTLNSQLAGHICKCLPELKERIRKKTHKYQAILRDLGTAVTEKEKCGILRANLNKFADYYCSTLDGGGDFGQLCGGAVIGEIFRKRFAADLLVINPLDDLSTQEVLTSIRNSTGARQGLSIPEVCFEKMVKKQLRRFKKPSLSCVEMVYDELRRIAEVCGSDLKQEIMRFPRLFSCIRVILFKLLQSTLQATISAVEDQVDMEEAYITDGHSALSNILKEYSMDKTVLEENDETLFTNEKTPKKTCICLTGEKCSFIIEKGSINIHEEQEQKTEKELEIEFTHTFGKQVDDLKETVLPKEKRDFIAVVRLVFKYFSIVRDIILSQVPKCIMMKMVNFVKEKVRDELFAELNVVDRVDELLCETKPIALRRKEAKEMLEALNKANLVISEIRDSDMG